MHTFLLIAGLPAPEAEPRARQALGRLAHALPDIGAQLQVRCQALEQLPGVWATLAPRKDYVPPLFDVCESPTHICMSFGKITGRARPAQALLEAYAKGGSEAARLLDGCFAGMVVARASAELVCFTDLIGMRAPRLARHGQQLYVSSHDLALVAAGALTGELDYDSLAATLICDWSVGGHALLRGVTACTGRDVARWSDGRLDVSRSDSLDLSQRVAARDTRGARALVMQIAEAMEVGARQFASDKESLRCSLTAGKDSRLVLALLLQTGKRPIVTQTAGTPDSIDASVARKIAALSGVEHEVVPVAPPDASHFDAMTRLLAFSMNGLTNAKRALAELPTWNPRQRVLAGGVGGGLFAGAFYHYFHIERRMPRSPEAIKAVLLKRRFRRSSQLRFSDPNCSKRVEQRLHGTLDDLCALSSEPYDIVDLFYLYERYALWAALGERNSWARRWTPFENAGALRLAYRLPAPIGDHATLQPLLVQRHLPPSAYWWPINREGLLPLQGGGALHRVSRKLLRRLFDRYWQLREPARREPESFESVRAAAFNGELKEPIAELLASPLSLATTLLGQAGIRELLERHQRSASELQPLGFLITAEIFMKLVEECAPTRRADERQVAPS